MNNYEIRLSFIRECGERVGKAKTGSVAEFKVEKFAHAHYVHTECLLLLSRKI